MTIIKKSLLTAASVAAVAGIIAVPVSAQTTATPTASLTIDGGSMTITATNFTLYTDGTATNAAVSSNEVTVYGSQTLEFNNQTGGTSGFTASAKITNFEGGTTSEILPVCDAVDCATGARYSIAGDALAENAANTGDAVTGSGSDLTTETEATSVSALDNTGVSNDQTLFTFTGDTGNGHYDKGVTAYYDIAAYSPADTYTATFTVTTTI